MAAARPPSPSAGVVIRPVTPQDPLQTLHRDGILDLAGLKAATMTCRDCPIGATATQSVVGEGPVPARLLLVRCW